MSAALAVAVSAPALALGSFLNVVASRLPQRRPVARGRSACMSCGTEIAARDNVPVVSWLALRGRCRTCAAPIPVRYPLVEAGTAALIVACVAVFGPTAYAALASLFCAVLVAVSAIDVEQRIIPNRIVLPAAGAVLLARTLLEPSPEWLLAAVGASGFLFLAALAYPKGMGMGDVKLALLLGAMLGRSVAVALMVAIVVALVPAATLVATRGVARARTTAIPFGPFLSLGAVVALFAGGAVLDWYLGLRA